jgi:hypothetical protein
MPSDNVLIEWKTGDPKNDRHMGRYRIAFRNLIAELLAVPEAKTILEKYEVHLIDNDRVGIDFPSDFDQSALPENLR